MMRLMEIMGLTVADINQIFGCFMAYIMFGVIMGNLLSFIAREILEAIPAVLDLLFDLIKKYILDKWKRSGSDR